MHLYDFLTGVDSSGEYDPGKPSL